MKIFLIGFMGAGKTTQGKALAKMLNFEFIDLDDLIVRELGRTIPIIFKEKGEDYFRREETNLLRSLESKEKLVVSVGGGTPCFNANIDWMNLHGKTFYLKLEPETLLSRILNSKTERPLIMEKSREEAREYIEKTLNSREKYYSKAQNIIDGRNLNTKYLYDLILSEL